MTRHRRESPRGRERRQRLSQLIDKRGRVVVAAVSAAEIEKQSLHTVGRTEPAGSSATSTVEPARVAGERSGDRESNSVEPKNARDESFNGAELSESVLARDWNSPEEDAAWS